MLSFSAGRAFALPPPDVPVMPEDMDQLEVSLLTIGRGPQIWALFGHTILRVQDLKTGRDWNFNWGIFDFNDPKFAWKFYKGDLRYMMVVTDFYSLVDHYRNYERRAMWQERLNLTANQKRRLMERLIENSKPENIHYAYSQFYDNCATKPRDHLDFALGGKIKDAYGKRAARVTQRHHIKRSADAIWWVHVGLDFLSNDQLDRPVTAWEEMFLPANFRDYLRMLPAYDDDGRPIPGKTLLEGTETVINLPEPKLASDPYVWLLILLGIPMAVGAVAVAREKLSERNTALVIGGMSLTFGFVSALFGTFMVANWVLSDYVELKHNAALWLLWPLDWLFVWYGIRTLIKRSRPVQFDKKSTLPALLAGGHLAFLAVALVLWLVGVIRQDMLTAFGCFGIIAVLHHGTLVRHAAAREV